MRKVADVRVPVAALAGRLGVAASTPLFEFLVRRIGIADVRLEGDEVVHSSFVPLEPLLRETLAELERSGVRPVPCRVCARVFDADREEGIFAAPARLEGFVCRGCAETLSAWAFYNEHLET